MRMILTASCLISLIAPVTAQSPVPVEPKLSQLVRIDSFQAHKRGDNYGIASLLVSNGTETGLKSLELSCWVNGDHAHGTKVLVWPSSGAIAAHASQQFSNVNIGLISGDSKSACEVTGVE